MDRTLVGRGGVVDRTLVGRGGAVDRTLVGRGDVVDRTLDTQSREPGLESSCCRFKPWATSRLSSLSCIKRMMIWQ